MSTSEDLIIFESLVYTPAEIFSIDLEIKSMHYFSISKLTLLISSDLISVLIFGVF